LRADVVDGESRALGGADAGVGEIVGVDELVEVVALAEHRDVPALLDPVEEDLEDPEPPVAYDRPRPDDRHVEAALVDEAADELLGGELRLAVLLHRRRDRRLVDRVRLRDAEHRARRRVDDLPDAGATAAGSRMSPRTSSTVGGRSSTSTRSKIRTMSPRPTSLSRRRQPK